MIEFVKQLVALVKPYRVRLILGIAMGILAGFMEPLAIAVFTGVFHLIFDVSRVRPVVSGALGSSHGEPATPSSMIVSGRW